MTPAAELPSTCTASSCVCQPSRGGTHTGSHSRAGCSKQGRPKSLGLSSMHPRKSLHRTSACCCCCCSLLAGVAIGASTAQHDSATAPPALRVSLPPRPSPRLLLLLLLPLPLPVLPWSAVVPFALGQRAPSSHTHAGCRPHNLRRWGATALLPHFTCSNALLCTAAAADAALAAAAAEVPHGPKPPCKAPPGPTGSSRSSAGCATWSPTRSRPLVRGSKARRRWDGVSWQGMTATPNHCCAPATRLPPRATAAMDMRGCTSATASTTASRLTPSTPRSTTPALIAPGTPLCPAVGGGGKGGGEAGQCKKRRKDGGVAWMRRVHVPSRADMWWTRHKPGTTGAARKVSLFQPGCSTAALSGLAMLPSCTCCS
mmetsp:Transcript_7905/g.21096  ORF Transcript_7905/g.21096 Transcript_7905/m.21096 type:complete len:372 (+) Transcript_7905:1237-2352(+)